MGGHRLGWVCQGVWGICTVLLAALPAAALVDVMGAKRVEFTWSAASGPVHGYIVRVSRDGGRFRVEQSVGGARALVAVGDSRVVAVEVRAFTKGEDGSIRTGPASPVSEPVRVRPPPEFPTADLWFLHCGSCATLAVRQVSDGHLLAEHEAPSTQWKFGGIARTASAKYHVVWWQPRLQAMALQDLAEPLAAGHFAYGEELEGLRFVGIADPDRDGRDEIVLQDMRTGAVDFWALDGGSVRRIGRVPGFPGLALAAVVDLTGDGYKELLWQHRDESWHAVVAWEMEGFAVASSFLVGAHPAWPQAPTDLTDAADYDGDGFVDLLFQGAGSLLIWHLEAGQVRGGSSLSTPNGDPAWQVVKSLDVDDRPGAEISVQHAQSGAVQLVYPASDTAEPQHDLALTPGPDWEVLDLP